MDINSCKKNNFKSNPKINIRDGTEQIIAIGNMVYNVLRSHCLYIESGLLEYFVTSLDSHPPTEKFLYQNTKHDIINSIE